MSVCEFFVTCMFLSFSGLADCVEYKDKVRFATYDYIVVGGGSSGSTVANGLSGDGKHTVLLLEAGGKPPLLSEIPLFALQLADTDIEWRNFSEPQENACQGSPEGRCFWSRAKVLGGCSTHNLMCWVRGNRRDYDNWERLGAKGWNYKNVLKLFKSIENQTDLTIVNNGYHGNKGYQTVSPARYKTELGEAYIEAFKDIGYQFLDDYNGPSQQGSAYIQLSQRDGLRCSTEKSFLRPAAERQNLDILIYAYVLNITLDEQKRATGVWFDHRGSTKYMTVEKELVLSAGVISSPVILMRSGIGPKEHLEEMKIPVVLDLPAVGQNLQDHTFFVHLNYLINETVGIVYKRDVNPETIAELLDGRGPLTSPSCVEVVGFFNSKYQDKSLEWPDMMLFAGACSAFTVEDLDLSDKNSSGLMYTLLHPKSRGYVKLRSANPYEDPAVDPRYFTDPEDMKRLIDGTKKILSLMERPALQRFNPVLTPKVLNGCENFQPDSDEYIECALRRYVLGGYHLCGTCKMGNPGDENTVVDPELRVKGVTGLRVADASIFPQIPSGNPNAACIMVGQKAADMILGKSG